MHDQPIGDKLTTTEEKQLCAASLGGKVGRGRVRLPRLLLAPKLLYLAVSLVYYTVYLYKAKFITAVLRLGDRQYGDISALMALVSCFAGTLWGSLADASGRHRLVLLLLCIGVAISFECTLWVRSVEGDAPRFYLSCVVLSFYSLFASGLFPLTDYLVLKMLSRIPVEPGLDSKDLYSRQVLFGTIGYGIVSLIVGCSIGWFTTTVLFYLLPLITMVALLAILTLAPSDDNPRPLVLKWWRVQLPDDTVQANVVEDTTETPTTGWTQHPIARLLVNGGFMFMLLVVLLTGSARAVMTTFISKYWEEFMHMKPDQVAIAANFGIVLEILIFGLGPVFLRVFGVYWMLLFAQAAMVVRAWAYVVLPPGAPAFYVYLVELLKGVGFGFTQTSGTKVANMEASPGLQATAQALYTTFYSHLPLVAVSWAGGRCYETWGPAPLFWTTAVGVTMALCLCTAKYVFDGSIGLCGVCPVRKEATRPATTV